MSCLNMKRANIMRANVLEKRPNPSGASTFFVFIVKNNSSLPKTSAYNYPNFYISPTMGQVINSLDPQPFTWNATSSCFSVPAINFYLYSPEAGNPLSVFGGV